MMQLFRKTKQDHEQIHWVNNKNIANAIYQERLDQHHQNASVNVKETGLIYDAICLAQNKQINSLHNDSENHPAIAKLCAFWDCYELDSIHEAKIPYIQLFLGDDHYHAFMPEGIEMPLTINEPEIQQSLKEASVIFGDIFLVTYLAGRLITDKKSEKESFVYYTVHDKPLFKERLLFSTKYAFNYQNQLAYQVLNGLHLFPKRFPKIWQWLKAEHDGQKVKKCKQGYEV